MCKAIEVTRTLVSQMGGSENNFHTEQLLRNCMRVLFYSFVVQKITKCHQERGDSYSIQLSGHGCHLTTHQKHKSQWFNETLSPNLIYLRRGTMKWHYI